MHKLIFALLALALACGSPDSTSLHADEVESSLDESTGILTITYKHLPEPEWGSTDEALTIPDAEGRVENLDNGGQAPCAPNVFIPSPGICLYPRDKVLAYYDGIASGTNAVLQTDVRAHFSAVYAGEKSKLSSGGWNLATNTSPSAGGDEVYLRSGSCPGGCLGQTSISYDTFDSKCTTRNGNKYCPQAASTGCITEFFETDMANDMASKGLTTASQRQIYMHNNIRHEVGHCMGLPHKPDIRTDIMFTFMFNRSETEYSTTELSALATFRP